MKILSPSRPHLATFSGSISFPPHRRRPIKPEISGIFAGKRVTPPFEESGGRSLVTSRHIDVVKCVM